MAELDRGLGELSSLGVFCVQLSGPLTESSLSETRALYFEWNRVLAGRDGDPREPPYSVYQCGGGQGGPVFLETPLGRFSMQVPSVALHLQPRVVQDFGKSVIDGEPLWVTELRSDSLTPGQRAEVLLVEYCLESGRDYWAEVETRYECLPPQPPSMEPEYLPYLRLRLSDRPFSSAADLGWPTMATGPMP